jgi:hypothetical protein
LTAQSELCWTTKPQELHRNAVPGTLSMGSSVQPPMSSSQVFMDLLMVWTQLSDRLSQSRERVMEADFLLKAIKLSISTMRSDATLPDGR